MTLVEVAAARGRRRRGASLALAGLGALLLLAGGVLLYANRTVFDSEQFADRAAATLHDERVRTPLAGALVDELITSGEPDLINARPVLVGVVETALDSGPLRSIFHQAVERAHRTVFTHDRDRLVLDLADATSVAIGAIRALSPELAKRIPKGVEPKLDDLVSSDFALELVKIAEDVREAGILLPLLGLLALAGAVGIDRDRRRGLRNVGLAVAVAAATGFAGLVVGRALIVARLDETSGEVLRAVWDAYLADLTTALLIALGVALVFAAAVSTRRRVDAVQPLRRIAAVAGRRPARPLGRALRALLVLAVGFAIVLSPDAFLSLLAVAVGAYAVFFALAELFELVAPARAGGGKQSQARRPRRRLARAIAVLAVLAAALVAAILIGRDGDPTGPRPAAEIERCNGFAELCDRRLDEVSLPAVHNAMSSADRDFLMANNAKGVPEQLEAGVRGLLIDAHWGRRGGGGTVVTDLEAEGGKGKAREEAVEATSEEFVAAAERLIQRRALGEAQGGEPGVYWCHVFCELGAIPAADLFADVREFLAGHPDEVVVLFVEDYVPPAEIERAAEASGLIDYVYTPPARGPLPTLRGMIASGRPVLVMAENEGGGSEVPWYVNGFDYAQETPYTFESPAALEARASCEENRGEPGNPLFQLNHWVEQVPRSPKTAARVNAYDFLLERARRCDRARDRLANLVAVDFWDQGDLLEVTRTLNGLPRGATPEYTQTG